MSSRTELIFSRQVRCGGDACQLEQGLDLGRGRGWLIGIRSVDQTFVLDWNAYTQFDRCQTPVSSPPLFHNRELNVARLLFSSFSFLFTRIRSWEDETLISAIDRTDFITWTICIRSNTFSRVNESSSTSARIVPNCSRVSRLNRFDHRSFFPGMFGRVKK